MKVVDTQFERNWTFIEIKYEFTTMVQHSDQLGWAEVSSVDTFVELEIIEIMIYLTSLP